MPGVHIWIKKEDWDKWQALADKPAWLHEKLNPIELTLDGMRYITDGMVGDETPQVFLAPASIAEDPEAMGELASLGMIEPAYTDPEVTA